MMEVSETIALISAAAERDDRSYCRRVLSNYGRRVAEYLRHENYVELEVIKRDLEYLEDAFEMHRNATSNQRAAEIFAEVKGIVLGIKMYYDAATEAVA